MDNTHHLLQVWYFQNKSLTITKFNLCRQQSLILSCSYLAKAIFDLDCPSVPQEGLLNNIRVYVHQCLEAHILLFLKISHDYTSNSHTFGAATAFFPYQGLWVSPYMWEKGWEGFVIYHQTVIAKFWSITLHWVRLQVYTKSPHYKFGLVIRSWATGNSFLVNTEPNSAHRNTLLVLLWPVQTTLKTVETSFNFAGQEWQTLPKKQLIYPVMLAARSKLTLLLLLNKPYSSRSLNYSARGDLPWVEELFLSIQQGARQTWMHITLCWQEELLQNEISNFCQSDQTA